MTARAKSDLVQELQAQVEAAVRQRGEEYFESGRVDLEFGNEREVLASVHGDHAYAVELARIGATIEALCTCPAFAAGPGVCKHVWATLLEAGDAGYLDQPGGPPPTLLLRALASWADPAPPAAPSGTKRAAKAEATSGAAAAAPARGNGLAGLAGAAGRSSSPWRRRLALAGMWPEPEAVPAAEVDGVFFVIEATGTPAQPGLEVEVMERRRNRRGEGKPRRAKLRESEARALPEGPLRSALLFLDAMAAAMVAASEAWRSWREDQLETRALVPPPAAPWLVPLLCADGRCFLRTDRMGRPDGRELLGPLRWDDGDPWRFHVELRRGRDDHWDVGATFRRGEQALPASEVVLALASGVLFTATTAARLDVAGAARWLEFFLAEPVIHVPVGEETEFLRGLLNAPSPPLLELPAELQISELRIAPRPVLRMRLPAAAWAKGAIPADPVFDYDGSLLPAGRPGESVLDGPRRRRVFREVETERALLARLLELGFQSDRSALPMVAMEIAPALFARAVSALLAEGWRVEAEGKPLRLSGRPKLAVKSGVDWFDLEGGVEFDGQEVALPELLAAVRRGESFVRLGDGGVGLLPEDWLTQVAPLAGLGLETDRVRLRFQRSQVGLLDALLEGRPEATCDRLFAEVRARLRAFDGVDEAREPESFRGELRAYQRQGLGWFRFLEEFGFGGCLADDMGLGKTVQVLALLEERRVLRQQAEARAAEAGGAVAAARFPPSLAVVPKSVVSNWIAEAARFTPLLRVHNQTGPERARTAADLYQYDLIVTTYGTLRRDVPLLAETEFDYVILDEAQAVKNRDSESAKAVRLLRGRHRLALTGTPVENHLGELWSLFEFLNPGMLGSASVFRRHAADLRDLDAAEATLLSRALRPFLLRRTKEQVAHDLPPKVEQTLLCELSGAERRRYDDLREFYRHHLAKQVDERGLGKSKILVLEALLRLRQAACHSGLLDPKLQHGTSAKFELLLGELREVLAEGHKALVFSQFTSLLALLRRRLDAEGIPYAYLDGRTRDRAERVREFQEDPEIPLFLISLKAGGVGLNLTAADYVYLLDPWWNPAVEAQAVDRSHRIGQVRPVFAYRLVARDTVEERILELQQRKRKLADAILQADPGVLRSLSREDLDLLLS